MSKVLKAVRKINRKPLVHAKHDEVMNDQFQTLSGPIDTQHMLISMMLPSAVKAFMQELEREVGQLCGERYKHGKANHRWGSQEGSIVLGNQQVAIEKPRVRCPDGEVPLATYERFQDPKLFQQNVFTEGLKKVSQRDYEKGLSKIVSSFGVSKSSVSRKWIKATAKKLEQLQTRSLKEMDIGAVFIDGKRFRQHGVIVAFGVARSGQKFVLGIYQASSESSAACLKLLSDLEGRGLRSQGLLFIVDGGSGLNKALNEKYDCHLPTRRAIRIRCFIHKWRNLETILGALSEKAQTLFWAIRAAKDMPEAKACSAALEAVLRDLNRSALASYEEAKDDLLVIHELGLTKQLKEFFSSTNPIESLNSLLEEDMRRVKKWHNSIHFQRWLATYCLANEKRMRKIRGHQALAALWVRVRSMTEHEQNMFDNQEVIA